MMKSTKTVTQKRIFSQIVLSLLVWFLSHCQLTEGRKFDLSDTNYVRHYYGKCVEYDEVRQVLIYGRLCREKFRWQGKARLIHIPTKKCLTANSTDDGTFLSLSNQCSSTDSLFQYDERNRVIRHPLSNKCLHSENGVADPAVNTGVVLKSGCQNNTNKFYFRKKAYYIIRHFNSLCWVYSPGDNLIKLSNPLACDRFEYVNDYHLKHVETGKCVVFSGSHLRLSDDCQSPQSVYRLNQYSLLQQGASDCVHPHNGYLNPPVGNSLVLYSNGCSNEDRLRFNFFDDKDILRVKVISQSCLDLPTGTACGYCKSHVIVNGHQYSMDTSGINVVLFDYRSGIFEYRKSHDVFHSSTEQDKLEAFLNNLPEGKVLFMSAKDAVNIDSGLAQSLQNVGVSATFASSPVSSVHLSLAFVGYTGRERKEWERSVNKVGGSGNSSFEVTIHTFHDRDGLDDCSNELGVRARKIPDERFFSNTVWANDYYHKPFMARLHLRQPGWCSYQNTPVSEYLQVDLGTIKLISGIALQSNGLGNDHVVTKFKIEYSKNGLTWKYYPNLENTVIEFTGLYERNMFETKINWFRNIRTRFIKIVPTARLSLLNIHCMRIELFGCSMSRRFIEVKWPSSPRLIVNEKFLAVASMFGTLERNITVGISTASDNNSLAKNIDQFHIDKVNATTTLDNGNVTRDSGTVDLVTDKIRQINSAAFVQFDIQEENYYAFNIDVAGKVLDAQLSTGDRYIVISFENDNGIQISSSPFQVTRAQPDRSTLQFNVTEESRQWLFPNNYLHLNLSVSHSSETSLANAYGVRIMIYYDNNFLQFKSLAFKNMTKFSLPPSRNTTKPGVLAIQTDTLWLPDSQHFSIIFQASYPKSLSKGDNCQGNVIIDFAYQDNLPMFNGKTNSTLGRTVSFKCKIDETRDMAIKQGRLPSPEFSMVYDGVNKEFFFCFQKKAFKTRSSTSCFLKGSNAGFWKNIPYISSLIAVDVERKILYALDRSAMSYLRSVYPYDSFEQIEDSQWTAISARPQLRTAFKAAKVDLLPREPEGSSIISESGEALWGATNREILQKSGGSWKREVSLNSFG